VIAGAAGGTVLDFQGDSCGLYHRDLRSAYGEAVETLRSALLVLGTQPDFQTSQKCARRRRSRWRWSASGANRYLRRWRRMWGSTNAPLCARLPAAA